jgi:hypothetical protein
VIQYTAQIKKLAKAIILSCLQVEYMFVSMRVVSTYSFCKELRDPISAARNPLRDEFDNSLDSDTQEVKH